MKKWPIRLVKFLVIVEIVYLVVINTALNLPFTQTAVNRIKPVKFTVTWDRAWSPYPFRVYAHGRHKIWFYQVQRAFERELRTNLSFTTHGGAFSLSNGEVDINLKSLVINGDHDVMREGHIKGREEKLVSGRRDYLLFMHENHLYPAYPGFLPHFRGCEVYSSI